MTVVLAAPRAVYRRRVLTEPERGLRGLTQAIARFNASDQADDQDGAVIALVEVVTWIAALDEWLWRDPAYEPGQVARAMRWARNRGLHQLAVLHEVSPGRRYPRRYPLRYRELVWLDRSKLPAGRPDPDAEQYYDQHLAGRTVRSTLPTALPFLEQAIR